MKTKVIVQATICVEIDGTWEDSTSLSQVSKDGLKSAIAKINNQIASKGFTVSEIKHVRTHLIND